MSNDISMSKNQLQEFLYRGRIARIATCGARLHLFPMWYLYKNRKIYIQTGVNSIKVKDIRRNNKVAMCVDVGEFYYDLKNVKMQGIARILEDKNAAREIAEDIMVKYLGSSTHPQAEEYLSARLPHLVIEITITHAYSEDYSRMLMK